MFLRVNKDPPNLQHSRLSIHRLAFNSPKMSDYGGEDDGDA